MNALILNHPSSQRLPAQAGAPPDPAEVDYLQRRAAEESEAARSASCSEARIVHEKLAEAYRERCTANEEEEPERL